MKLQIRHRRLYAFFHSVVLNSLGIVIMLSLFLIGCCEDYYLPLSCASLAFLFFAGYSVWFWIKKPSRIIVNRHISEISSMFAFYYLIVSATSAENRWFYISPLLVAIAVLFIFLVKNQNETFEIY